MPKGVKRVRDQSGRVRSTDQAERNAAKTMEARDVKRLQKLQAAKDQAKHAKDGPGARASPLRSAEKLKMATRPRKYPATSGASPLPPNPCGGGGRMLTPECGHQNVDTIFC